MKFDYVIRILENYLKDYYYRFEKDGWVTLDYKFQQDKKQLKQAVKILKESEDK